jgi:hypothetical protein
MPAGTLVETEIMALPFLESATSVQSHVIETLKKALQGQYLWQGNFTPKIQIGRTWSCWKRNSSFYYKRKYYDIEK